MTLTTRQTVTLSNIGYLRENNFGLIHTAQLDEIIFLVAYNKVDTSICSEWLELQLNNAQAEEEFQKVHQPSAFNFCYFHNLLGNLSKTLFLTSHDTTTVPDNTKLSFLFNSNIVKQQSNSWPDSE